MTVSLLSHASYTYNKPEKHFIHSGFSQTITNFRLEIKTKKEFCKKSDQSRNIMIAILLLYIIPH